MMSASTQHAAPVPGCLVVGIGASAGGLNAFKAFFTNMPADSGMAFVLIPHLDPSHATFMVELVARCTRMKVEQARDGVLLAPDQVFIIPPNKYLTLERGILRLIGPVQRQQTAIDCFLQSLAADQRENAIGIILSGTGAHGTLGMKAIKACGGMAMVQDPASAEHDSMPQSAIETGVIDCIRRVEDMPETLVRYSTHLRALRGQPATGDGAQDLDPLIALLRTRCGHDFGHYRRRMLMRRIERRMSLCRVERLADYVDFLQGRPEEAAQLVKDLLIRVTGFFRDPDAFQILKLQVLPKLLASKTVDTPLRVWVAGCATGEEAYSLAILIHEQLAVDRRLIPLAIFATDVDDDALAVARHGAYPESSITNLSTERLLRFFVKEGDAFRVTQQLRESVTFSRHNLITDVPFAHLDLICCRNVLIYLEPRVQMTIVRFLHHALDDGGYLLLGPSETVGEQAGLFEPIARRWRVFRRIGSAAEIASEVAAAHPGGSTGGTSSPVSPGPRQRGFAELTKRALLEAYAPAAVLIDHQQRVLYFHGPTDRFLKQPSGEPTSEVLALARDGMRARLRAAIDECLNLERVAVRSVRIKRDDEYHSVTMTVQPVQRPAPGHSLLLVTFAEEPVRSDRRLPKTIDEPLVRQLEDDLKAARQELQSTIEEMQGTNEELKTSNEEVMSMNEEMQSAHEEMETSKEELQSLNEELSSANGQLADKVDELERINNDLSNLLSSTDIALVFLDTSLRITRFTRAATNLLHVVDRDVGRLLSEIARRFTDVNLLTDAASVLTTLAPVEKEIDGEDNRRYLRRILPYRTALDRVGGVVITFLDVTQLRRAAEHERWLATVLTDSNDAILVTDLAGKIQAWNRGASTMYGYHESEAMGMNVEQLVPVWLRAELRDLIGRLCRGDQITALETQRFHKDGHALDVWLTMTPLRDDDGRPVAIARTERDITSRKALEREVLETAANEQQRIGQDLHDNTGQELTGLGLMAQSLADALTRRAAAEATLAAKIAAGLRLTLAHVRILAKGLVPVEIDAVGLTSALTDLAAQTSSLHDVKCVFTCHRPVPLDNFTATHLYRIAQEAITNSIKHGPAPNIIVTLATADDVGTLEIIDDGVGIVDPDRRGDGIGLRIMSYRARLIGATLNIERGKPSGTHVICTFSAANPPNRSPPSHEREKQTQDSDRR